MITKTRRLIRQKARLPLLAGWLLAAGCSCDDEKIVNLGGNYHLFTFTGEARIENMSSTNALPIPHHVKEIGWNEKYIVARVSEAGTASHIWIIEKTEERVSGPLTPVELAERQKTNSALQIKIRPIQKVRN